MKPIDAAILLDYYGGLLTERQRRVMSLYCDFDLTPSEIAEELSMTRQAAHDIVSKCRAMLDEYEAKLGLAGRGAALKAELERAVRLIESGDIPAAAQKLTKITESI